MNVGALWFRFNIGKQSSIKKNIRGSCALTWRNRHIIFGAGYDPEKSLLAPEKNHREILEVTNCGLTRIGRLNVNFYLGGCAIGPNYSIYLCFSNDLRRNTDQAISYYNRLESMTCRVANGPLEKFERVTDLTKYGHANTKIAASSSEYLYFLFYFDT